MSALREGIRIGGKYVLVAPLAQGGMGALWTARHVELGHEVAIKFVAAGPGNEPAARARFRREARAAASLKSAHVSRIFDFGEQGERPYIAMELLEGEDLAAILAREGALEPRRFARVLEELAIGLGEAHDKGIVHRDLKPSNVFLARIADAEVTKVLDFGIAKELSADGVEDVTATNTLVGSPRYMSPEQIRSLPIDARSDLWSLGVLAFEALSGKRLFRGQSIGAVIAAVTSDPIPRFGEVAVEHGERFDAFFARALSRDRERRFQSVRELAEAFSRACHADSESIVPMVSAPTSEGEALGRAEVTADLPAPTVVAEVSPVESQHEAQTEAPTLTELEKSGAPRKRLRWFATGGAFALGVALAGVAIVRASSPRGTQTTEPPIATSVLASSATVHASASATASDGPVPALVENVQPSASVASTPASNSAAPWRRPNASRPTSPSIPASTPAKSSRDETFGITVSKKRP